MYPSTIWHCLHYFTSLDSVCSLRKIRCQPAVFYLHCNRRTEVSQSILVFAAYSMPSQANQFCSVLFEPSQISSPTDEMQTLTAALLYSFLPSSEAKGFISPTSKSSSQSLYVQKKYLFSCCMYGNVFLPFVCCVVVQ